MSADRRYRNMNWQLEPINSDHTTSLANIQAALLMDLRDRMDQLLALLGCSQTQSIPRELRKIRENTTRTRKRPR